MKQFFMKSIGKWESNRMYTYLTKGTTEVSTTILAWSKNEDDFYVTWKNEKLNNKGQMKVSILSDYKIERSRGMFSDKPTVSEVLTSSKDYLKTQTCYDGKTSIEEIEFLTDDVRVRRTLVTRDSDGLLLIVGNYTEYRIL